VLLHKVPSYDASAISLKCSVHSKRMSFIFSLSTNQAEQANLQMYRSISPILSLHSGLVLFDLGMLFRIASRVHDDKRSRIVYTAGVER
jgi:hypothetical protein